jgi:endonuclease/exonuclease/phosphatase family metal-dependent hydrolase
LSVTSIKIVTINILRDLSRWEQRRKLLVEGLAGVQADIIAIQEVALPEDNAAWLAEQLNQRTPANRPYAHYLCPKTGQKPDEGIAILSRLPVEEHATLDLGSQNRVAQSIRVETDTHTLVCANVHLFWFPGDLKDRLKQVGRLIRWLDKLPQKTGLVLCGDFNSPPHSSTILKLKRRFVSAYQERHGSEPKCTVPTQLPVSKLFQAATLRFILANWKHILKIDPTWQGTLDYIFINKQLKVEECELILNQPAPDNHRLYPSDHFGLYARIAQGDPPESRKNI